MDFLGGAEPRERVEPRLKRETAERRTGCYGERRTGVTNKQTNKHNADDDLMGAVLITAM